MHVKSFTTRIGFLALGCLIGFVPSCSGGGTGDGSSQGGSGADVGGNENASSGGEQQSSGEGGSPGENSGGVAGEGAAGLGGGPAAGGKGGNPGSPDAGATGGKATVKLDAMPSTDTPPAAGGPFACTQFIGPNVTGEWYDAGFENHVDGGRWQVKAPHLSFIEYWADANHAVWRESGCAGTFSPCETRSKCAGGKAPDRIIFVTQTGNYQNTPQKTWETMITSAIKTIKTKYPSVKVVELMTFMRGPGNANCGTETVVAKALDDAHRALAAASGGTITVAPRFEMSNCNQFSSAPHLSSAGNSYAANLAGKHYGTQEKAQN